MRDPNPRKPLGIVKDLAARARWGRRRKQRVVRAAAPAHEGTRVIPVSVDSRGSGSWGAQRRGDGGTDRATTMDVEIGKLGRRGG